MVGAPSSTLINISLGSTTLGPLSGVSCPQEGTWWAVSLAGNVYTKKPFDVTPNRNDKIVLDATARL